MMKIPPRKTGGLVTTQEYNELLALAIYLLNLRVGQGLEIRECAGAKIIVLKS